MISFYYPQLLTLLLLLPLVWRCLTARRLQPSTILRMALFSIAVLAVARPRLSMESDGTDLIVLVDRSASCDRAADATLRELLPSLRSDERDDRLAIIGFGESARVEQSLNGEAMLEGQDETFTFASNLDDALGLARSLTAPTRRTALFCISDGLHTGADPRLRVGDSTPPFYHRHLGKDGVDIAAGAIVVPEEVQPRSAWLVRFTIQADEPVDAEYALSVNGRVLVAGNTRLRRGDNHFYARDTVDSEGMLQYRLVVRAEGDAVPGNNISRALLTVRTAPRTLLVTDEPEPGLLADVLNAASMPFDLVKPTDFPRSAAELSSYRLVVLENSPVSAFPGRGVEALAQAVENGITSLLVTGGPQSFGVGGYHRSALDPLLPVELEMRDDIRRGAVAIAFALDRSGSMAMSADRGRTKMDLANAGAAESILLLSARDQVAVFAVDTAAHVVVPMSQADASDQLAGTVRGIRSMGGGIFCRTAIEAAAAELAKSILPGKHIILFADASDAEEQEGCVDLAATLHTQGVALSVIAMGTPADSDAAFLRDLARAGGGECLFSSHAGGLPALFTQEMMRISQRGFVEEQVTPSLVSGIVGYGLELDGPSPSLDGYNISSLRDNAIPLMRLDDEFATPFAAVLNRGKTATAALLFQVDGPYSGNFAAWPEARPFLASLLRRLAGSVTIAGAKTYVESYPGGAKVQFDFPVETAQAVREENATVAWLGPGGETIDSPLQWIGPETAVSTMNLTMPGHYLAVADLGSLGRVAAPPCTKSYGDEFLLRPVGEGRRMLVDLAAATGGGEGLVVSNIRSGARALRDGGRELTAWLLVLALVVFVMELSGRRLSWFR